MEIDLSLTQTGNSVSGKPVARNIQDEDLELWVNCLPRTSGAISAAYMKQLAEVDSACAHRCDLCCRVIVA